MLMVLPPFYSRWGSFPRKSEVRGSERDRASRFSSLAVGRLIDDCASILVARYRKNPIVMSRNPANFYRGRYSNMCRMMMRSARRPVELKLPTQGALYPDRRGFFPLG